MRGKGYRVEVSYFQITQLKINGNTTFVLENASRLTTVKSVDIFSLGLKQLKLTMTEGLH